MDSGRYEAVKYGVPVHYLEGDEYVDIDNRLSLETDENGLKYYTNNANDFKASFSAVLSDAWAAGISKEGYEMKWALEGTTEDISAEESTYLTEDSWNQLSEGEQRRNLPNISSQVIYSGVFPATELNYQLIGNVLKENIKIYGYSGENKIQQKISLKNLELIQKEDGTIVAIDPNNKEKEIFYLLSPYAVDSGVEIDYNDSIKVTLTNVKDIEDDAAKAHPLIADATNTYILTYTLDLEWLKTVTYPITIDPTVTTSIDDSDIADTRINQNYPNQNYYNSYIMCTGRGSLSGINYSLVEFSNMPVLSSAEMVVYSGLRLKKPSTSSAASKVAVHEITSSWNEMTVTWNTKPTFDSTVEDYCNVDTAAGGTYEWNITHIAKRWYTGGTNNGLLLKGTTDTTAYNEWYTTSATFGDVPYAYFVYVNYSGLENYWDYTSASIGRGGTASVNLYNGNLIYTHTDISKTGNRMPVTIAHVFNSTTKDANDSSMLYGNGWRTNYDQRIAYVNIGGTNYYKYTDGDGTEHYFVYYNDEWVSEDGLNFDLIIHANDITIQDKTEDKLVFYLPTNPSKPGFLNYIVDSNGNQQTVDYDANNRIRGIIYNGGEVLFQRDVNNYLYKIREEVSSGTYRETTFTYNNSKLVTITYPDAEQTNFTYDANGNIDYVTGIDGKKIDISYLSSSPYRVSYMDESTATEDGGEISFSYDFNLTKLTDSEGRGAEYQFNDYGNTVCVIAPDGSAAYTQYGTTSTSGDMSKITSASDSQKFGKNYLRNSNMESASDWLIGSYLGTGTHGYSTDQKYLGTRSIKLTNTDVSDYQWTEQRFDLEKGKTYTLSGYIKTENVAYVGEGAFLDVFFYTGGGQLTGTWSPQVYGTNDWQRYSLTFTLPADSTTTNCGVNCKLSFTTGTAWFDCLQLEEGSVVNRYNIIDNADFDYATSGVPDKWTRVNCGASDVVITTSDSSNPDYMSDSRFKLVGDPAVSKYIDQTIYLSGAEGDCFVAGAWGKGDSVHLTGGRKFGIALYIDYTDPQYGNEWVVIPFSECSGEWQYVCSAIVAKHDYQSILVRVEYHLNANIAEFDGIQLYKESFGNTYSYDADGNIVSIKDAGNREEQFQYTNNNLTRYIDPQGNEFTYTYDGNHNLLTATSAEGVIYTYTYDGYGNVTSAKVGDAYSYIRATVNYDGSGNYVDYVTDPFGNQLNYTYDTYKGTLTSVTDPLNYTTNYVYNSDTDMLTGTSMASGGTTVSSSYTYTDDRLTEVSHNSPNSGSVDYTFSYNTLGWNTGTSVGAQSLITRSLEENTGRLNSVTYGNGQTLSYTYDAYDRVIKVSQGATDLYAYEYDNSGNVGYVKDFVQNAEYRYEYDSLNRLGMITKKDSTGTCTTTYSYNNVDSVSSFKEKIYGTDYETAYTYDDDGKADTSTFGTYSIDNAYNATLGTLTGTSIKNGANTIYSTSIGYEAGDGTTSVNSGRVSSITNGAETLSYTYDDRGYITRIQKDANNYSEYRYDAFGQLIRENYKWGGTSYTVLYTYDVGGNILSKGQYAFVAGDGAVGAAIDTVAYTYDATWKDKLASYDGVGITYDNIGNPTDDGTWEYTWTQGRKLQQMTDGATTASFKYNDDGIRTEKTVNGTTTKYNVVGGNVTWEKTGASNPIYFLYDASGSLWGLKYTDGNLYFYVYNAQGDIIKIVNSSGTVVVEYGYDAWGNLLFTSGSMAGTLGADNPFRYRGYYYDDETELYCLNSRYYSPEWSRFINADDEISTRLLGYNLFSYCLNNPVNYIDYNGHDAELIFEEWAAEAWSLTLLDGPLPIGDIIYGVGLLVLGIIVVCTVSDVEKRKHKKKSESLPTTGEPNSSSDLHDDEGLKQRRYYGPDGKAERDIDYRHSGEKHKFPHQHKWDWSKVKPRQGETPILSLITRKEVYVHGFGR